MKRKPDPTTLRRRAMDLLARREHGERELKRKLISRGFEPEDVKAELERLEDDGLLSNRRFAEEFVRARIDRGMGPLRILADLHGHGIPESDISAALNEADPDWPDLAAAARRQRFGDPSPQDFEERARQTRFLQRRGFEPDHIQAAMRVGSK